MFPCVLYIKVLQTHRTSEIVLMNLTHLRRVIFIGTSIELCVHDSLTITIGNEEQCSKVLNNSEAKASDILDA